MFDRRLTKLERQRMPQKPIFSATVMQELEAMVTDDLSENKPLSAAEEELYRELDNADGLQSIAEAIEKIVYFKKS